LFGEEQKRDTQFYVEALLPQVGFDSGFGFDSNDHCLGLRGDERLKAAIVKVKKKVKKRNGRD
jgi:hypothetical protein